MNRAISRGLSLLAALCAVGVPARALPPDPAWRTHEGARLVPNPSNDGDSFHVVASRHRYIFRLYFVDAPETDDTFPDRIKEQADYWGITARDVLRMGNEAAAVTTEHLGRGAFVVHTKLEDARGMSQLPRHYAMVEIGPSGRGTNLCEILVARGLARIHGMDTDLPDGSPGRKYWTRLKSLERTARAAGVGCWGVAAKRQSVGGLTPGLAMTLRRPVTAYAESLPARYLGVLPAGTPVHVEELNAQSLLALVRVTAAGFPERVRCRRMDLEVNLR